MRTAVEDDDPGVRLKHKTLLMGKTIRHPVIIFFQIHMLPFSGFLHIFRTVGDQPDAVADLQIPRHTDDPVSVLFQHPALDPDIFHLSLFAVIAVLPAGLFQIKFCFIILLKEHRHTVRMVIVCMGEHGIVHVSQIQTKLLSVLRKQPALPRIKQDLLILILYIEAQAPLARKPAASDIVH